jgi:acyl-CoA synthetase (AMP-forming)/AMP-acid ligase II/acyl carrier protein
MVTVVLPDLLDQRTREAPDATAVVLDGGGALSYRSWEQRSNAAARGLAAHGVRPGDRVALTFDNPEWLDYAVSYLAVLKAGAVAVPVGHRFAGPELAHVLDHCGARAIVGPRRPGVAADRQWLDLGDVERDQSTERFQADVGDGDLAEILYTSGTTGLPKGVACTHASVVLQDPPPEGDTPGPASVVHAFPVGTNAGQELLRLPLRRADRTSVALAHFDPDRYCTVIAERAVRRIQLVPAMAQLLLASGALERHDVGTVERVVLSSAPAPTALIAALGDALPQAALWNTYALTEAGTARTLNTDARTRPESVGRPVGGTELRIVDPSGDPVAPGEAGEVLIRRPGAPTRSYYRDPEATEATFAAGGWVRTGDLGFVAEDGSLYLVDRKKDLVLVGGLNVSSVEVENVLYNHPAVADAAVFGVEHPVLGQDVAAAVVARRPVEVGELQAFVRARLGEHKVPHRVAFVAELPRTPSGKVRKVELREQFATVPSGVVFVAPRTPVEAAVVAIWEEVLGRDGIGVDDDFFELGGHSLAATQIVARLEDKFSITLPVAAVFDWPTPAALSDQVDKVLGGSGDPSSEGTRPGL